MSDELATDAPSGLRKLLGHPQVEWREGFAAASAGGQAQASDAIVGIHDAANGGILVGARSGGV